MKIKFITPSSVPGKIKCTVHLNGKLGFSQAAVKKLDISEANYIKIGINDEDRNDSGLYIAILKRKDEDAFKVNKAGNYYYLNTMYLFDELKIDYRKKKIIYDIQEIEHEGMKMYKLDKRELNRNPKK